MIFISLHTASLFLLFFFLPSCSSTTFFLLCLVFYHRSLTSNLPNVSLPIVNLQMPKVPNLPVSVNLPPVQIPLFSTPSWMTAVSDAECVTRVYDSCRCGLGITIMFKSKGEDLKTTGIKFALFNK